MENLFNVSNVKEFIANSQEMANRWNETARAMWDAQLAAAQQATVEAVNRSFDLVREATRVADQQVKTATEQARKAWAQVPGMAA